VSALIATLHAWDWTFVVWTLAVTIGVGIWYSRRASRNLDEYFLSGRDLPWWALGTSMVATTFAADTPLAVTGFVVKAGVAGNWIWWNFLIGGALTVFVFSRLWRRSRVVTEIELIERRYDGKAARVLRSCKAVYLGLVLNSIVIGWVTKGMVTVMQTVFPDVDPLLTTGILMGLTLVYTTLAGLWGVVATDVLQFSLAMVGSVMLAALAVAQVGGLTELTQKIGQLGIQHQRDFLSVMPTGQALFALPFVFLVLVNWWAVYYPGAEPGGGGYIAQRMLAAKDERHARAGTLWFLVAHYALRPWPWILVALSAIALEPRFLDYLAWTQEQRDALPSLAPERAYPSLFRLLPVGLYGLVVASFLAAYMSTITTQLNLAASYLVNDLYLPLARRRRDHAGPGAERKANADREDKNLVWIARAAVLLVAAIGCCVSWLLVSVGEGWTVVMELTAGTGLVLILRWLWWRVNAWSEIAAIAASAACFVGLRAGGLFESLGGDLRDKARMLVMVGVATLAWILVTLGTRPVAADKLAAFYRDIRPGGWWGPVAAATGIAPASLRRDVRLWLVSMLMVFSALFAVGAALFQQLGQAAVWAGTCAVCVWVLARGMRKE
jgi:Na+/proline symporter